MSNNQNVQLVDFTPQIETLRRPTRVRIGIDKGYIGRQTRARPYRSLPYLFRPALEQIGDYVRTRMIPETFAKEGPGWAPLARRTRREREWLGYGAAHPILHRTGDLYEELTRRSHPQHIEIIRTGRNARIEIGGSSKKFIENQVGNAAQHLPPRPMIAGAGGLPLPEHHRRAMQNILDRAIRQRLRR